MPGTADGGIVLSGLFFAADTAAALEFKEILFSHLTERQS